MKIFLSYSMKDLALASKIGADLQSAGLEIWDAHREILPGDNWAEKISDALKESEGMVVLLTPDALDSLTVRREIEYALGSQAYERRLIPVVVGDLGQLPQQKIPWILRRLKMVVLAEEEPDEKHIEQIAAALKEAA